MNFVSAIIPAAMKKSSSAYALIGFSNDYPQRWLEVLVVDGMNQDGNQAIAEVYAV